MTLGKEIYQCCCITPQHIGPWEDIYPIDPIDPISTLKALFQEV